MESISFKFVLLLHIFFLTSFWGFASNLPPFLTKYTSDSLRYIDHDGKFTYLQKKPGTLSLISGFQTTDVIKDDGQSDFIVKESGDRVRLVIESIPEPHAKMGLINNYKILVIDFGNSKVREIGWGRNPRLHLKDEWISYFDIEKNVIHLLNLMTQKKFELPILKKSNPFFLPDVEMVSPQQIIYTDVNQSGHSALVSYNLFNLQSTIIQKSPQIGTKMEICKTDNGPVVGEFPYEGVDRSSRIQFYPFSSTGEISGFDTIYESSNPDVGNLLCLKDSVYFVKTVHQNQLARETEAAKISLKDKKLEIKSDLKQVSQILKMDGRVLIPFRGEIFVLEGKSDLSEDKLKILPQNEEIEIDL